MKNFLKLMVPVLVIALVAALFCISSSAEEVFTVYISDAGAGTKDGSSAANAMGNDADYDEFLHDTSTDKTEQNPNNPRSETASKVVKSAAAYGKTALFKASKLIVEEHEAVGKIVICGPTTIHSGDAARVNTPAEFQICLRTPGTDPETGEAKELQLPGHITYTSNDGKVDYQKTNGAKLIFDETEFVFDVELNHASTFENITLETKTGGARGNWSLATALHCCGHECVFGEGITCINEDDLAYPSIFGGFRYQNKTINPNVTVKSGRWEMLLGGSYGMNADNAGNVTGNTTVNVFGGKFDFVCGTGSINRPNCATKGDVTVNVYGGEIAEFAFTNNGNVEKNEADENSKGIITVNVAKDAKIDLMSAIAGSEEKFEASVLNVDPASSLDLTKVAGVNATNKVAVEVPKQEEQKQEEKKEEQKQEEQKKDNPTTGSYVTVLAFVAVAALAVSVTVIRKKVND